LKLHPLSNLNGDETMTPAPCSIDKDRLRRTIGLLDQPSAQALRSAIFHELDLFAAGFEAAGSSDVEKIRRLIHRLRGFSLQFHLSACAALTQAKEQFQGDISAWVSSIVSEVYLTRIELDRFFQEVYSGRA
jgi:hypothetical protein